MSTKDDLRKFVQKYGKEFTNVQTARLGNLAQVVETGTPGLLWARQWNGKEIKVINRAFVPSTFDLRVLVGSSALQPSKWFILLNMEDYLTPATGGQVAFHHTQHEFGGSDEVSLDRRQLIAYTIRATNPSSFSVKVYGGYFPSTGGFGYTAPQTVLDLSAYVADVGAKYVSIEVDDDGTLSVNDTGTNFYDPALGGIAYVPSPDPGKYHVGFVLMHEGQTSIIDDEIRVPMPLGVIAKSAGLQIDDAAADTPLDADEFGFWDVVDSLLKKITWANIKATLKTYFDTLYSALGHTHPSIFNDAEGNPSDVTTGSAADGTSAYAARRDHVHHIDLTPVGQYRQFAWADDGAGGWEFITADGEPVLHLQDLE